MEAIMKNKQISEKIVSLVGAGLTLKEAIDAVLGAGTFAKIAADTHEALRNK